MTKKPTLEQLKKRIARLPVNRTGTRRHYPEALKKAVLAFVEHRKQEGETQLSLAAELGINYAMLSDWKRKSRKARTKGVQVRRVCVVDEQVSERSKTVTVTLPSGIRVEGLELEGLIKLVQELS